MSNLYYIYQIYLDTPCKYGKILNNYENKKIIFSTFSLDIV